MNVLTRLVVAGFMVATTTSSAFPSVASSPASRPFGFDCKQNYQGPGPGAFVGGNAGNYAPGTDSFVGAGVGNIACDTESAVAGGLNNNVTGNTQAQAQASFIGGGSANDIGEAYSAPDNRIPPPVPERSSGPAAATRHVANIRSSAAEAVIWPPAISRRSSAVIATMRPVRRASPAGSVPTRFTPAPSCGRTPRREPLTSSVPRRISSSYAPRAASSFTQTRKCQSAPTSRPGAEPGVRRAIGTSSATSRPSTTRTFSKRWPRCRFLAGATYPSGACGISARWRKTSTRPSALGKTIAILPRSMRTASRSWP